MNDAAGRCPVCQARFRGAAVCSRCGADLEPLMRLVLSSWRDRQSARDALSAGDFPEAAGLAARAQQTCFTAIGEKLRLLCAFLSSDSAPEGSRSFSR